MRSNCTNQAPRRTLNNLLNGFTLTETAIVLCIFGLVLGGIWIAYRDINENLKIKQANEILIKIVQNIRANYVNLGQFSSNVDTDITTALIDKGVFPPEIVNTAGGTSTPWVTSTDATRYIRVIVGPNTRNVFTVSFASWPSDAIIRRQCTIFLTSNFYNGPILMFAQLSGSGTSAAWRNPTDPSDLPPDNAECTTYTTGSGIALGYGAHMAYRLR